MTMRRSSFSRWTRSGCIAAGAAVLLLGSTPAMAQRGDGAQRDFQRGQQRGFGQQRGMQNWYRSPIDSAELQRMVDQLSLDDAQKEIAGSLLEGFRASMTSEMESAQQKMRDEFEQLRENGQWQDMMSRGMTMTRDWQTRAKAMENTFIADVKSVLTEDQLGQWGTYNRGLKRRAANVGTSRIGALSGENVDLYELVDDLEIDQSTRASLAPVLEAYSIELEPAIDNRQRLLDKVSQLMADGFEELSPEEMENQFNTLIRSRTLIRDLNDRYLQLVQASLSGDSAQHLGAVYREQAFGGIYRNTRADRYFETVHGVDSLTDAQRTALDAIAMDYENQLKTVNQQLADIQRKTEIDNQRRMLGRIQQFASGSFQRGGGQGGFEPSPDDQKRRELFGSKNELISKTITAISNHLTPDQLAQAPVPEERAQREGRQRLTEQQIEEFRRRRAEREQRDTRN